MAWHLGTLPPFPSAVPYSQCVFHSGDQEFRPSYGPRSSRAFFWVLCFVAYLRCISSAGLLWFYATLAPPRWAFLGSLSYPLFWKCHSLRVSIPMWDQGQWIKAVIFSSLFPACLFVLGKPWGQSARTRHKRSLIEAQMHALFWYGVFVTREQQWS